MDVLEISLMNVSDPRFQAKFWEQVVSNGLCWEWQGAKNESGYGLVWVNGKLVRAHRVSYVMAYGSIATDKVACHTCDNPSCVNPMHIYAGTVKDNVADCVARGRQRGRRGERLKKYPLSTEEIIALRTRYSAGSPIDGLAKE